MSTSLDPATLASSTEIAPTTPTSPSSDSPADESSDQKILGTSSQAIIVCNSISVAACVLVIIIYVLLHRKHTRLMQRTSLVLSCAMATSDLLLHVSESLTEIYDMGRRCVTRIPLRKSTVFVWKPWIAQKDVPTATRFFSLSLDVTENFK
jgi:hypothetical protein